MSRLSVIVPGYRTAEAWWTRCLVSVVQAIDTTDEIVCVDDGSPDGALFLDEGPRRDTRLRVIHRRNGGLSVARNTAMAVCRGNWVTFVDSDDEVTDSVYRKTLAACERYHADIGLFGVRTVWVHERLEKCDVPMAGNYGRPAPATIAELRQRRILNYAWNKLYRKAFLNAHRLMFAEHGMPCEDVVFNLGGIIAGARWCAVDMVGYVYYRTEGTLLSRYRPFNGEGLALETEMWRRYCETSADAEIRFKHLAIQSRGRLLWAEWSNIQRLGSPYTAAARAHFLRRNREFMVADGGPNWQARLLRVSPWCLVAVCFVSWVLRRCLYSTAVRRWRIRRRFPHAMPLQE